MLERIGMAVIALVLAALFAVVAVASFAGGEPFLGVMGAHRLPDGALGRRADAVPGLSGSIRSPRHRRPPCTASASNLFGPLASQLHYAP